MRMRSIKCYVCLLETKSFGILYSDKQLLSQNFLVCVRRKYELVEACVRHRKPTNINKKYTSRMRHKELTRGGGVRMDLEGRAVVGLGARGWGVTYMFVSLTLVIFKVISDIPPIGTRSLPVAKRRNRFWRSWWILRSTSQKWLKRKHNEWSLTNTIKNNLHYVSSF